jgi:hypothetical protein
MLPFLADTLEFMSLTFFVAFIAIVARSLGA